MLTRRCRGNRLSFVSTAPQDRTLLGPCGCNVNEEHLCVSSETVGLWSACVQCLRSIKEELTPGMPEVKGFA